MAAFLLSFPFLINWVALLCLPISEFLILRIYLRYFLELRIGWHLITDYDLILPGILALGILIWALHAGRALKLALQKQNIAINLCAVALFIFCSRNYYALVDLSPMLAETLWLTLAASWLVSALFVLAPFSYLICNPNRWSVAPALGIASAPVFTPKLFNVIWHPVSAMTANGVCLILRAWSLGVSCFSTPLRQDRFVIRHEVFGVSIAKACSGLESLSLFVLVWAILIMMYPRRNSPWKWGLYGLAGLALAYLLNLLRIALFFVLAVFLTKYGNEDWGAESFLFLLHTHAGWIFSLAGSLLYCRLILAPARAATAPSWSRAIKISLVLFFGLSFYSPVANAAACSEMCTLASDCAASCPICIGICVDCYHLGNQAACLDSSSGGNSFCQWDGHRCKRLTDAPEYPSQNLWFYLVVPVWVGLAWHAARVRRKLANQMRGQL